MMMIMPAVILLLLLVLLQVDITRLSTSNCGNDDEHTVCMVMCDHKTLLSAS